MTRREIFSLALTACVGAPALWMLGKSVPEHHVEAVRSRFYPGTVRRLKQEELLKPAQWAG
jgi:hypothetical protein